MSRQYPKTGGYFCHKRRDIYGKLYKTLIFGFVKFNPWKFFLPGFVEFTNTRFFVLVFLHCCGDVFLVWWRWSLIFFLALNFPKVEQTHRDLLEDWHRFRALFEPKQACTYTASISQRKKHFNKKSLLIILIMQVIDSGPYKAEWKNVTTVKKLFYSSYRTSASWVLVVRIKKLLVSDERMSERFFPCNEYSHGQTVHVRKWFYNLLMFFFFTLFFITKTFYIVQKR